MYLCLLPEQKRMFSYIATCIFFSVFLNNWIIFTMENVQNDMKPAVGKHGNS